MNTLQKFEEKQLKKLTENKKIDNFTPGDTVRVNVRIIEGTNERIQAFEGVCIAKKNRGLQSSFTVRKISHGEGVERVFSLYSPLVESVNVVRVGEVRRAKLYYMRALTGKAARIKEKQEIFGLAGAEAGEIAVAADAPIEEPKEKTEAEIAAQEKQAEESKKKAEAKAEKKAAKDDKKAAKKAKKSEAEADKKDK